MEGVAHFVAKKAIGAPDARAEWGKCVTEFGKMISEEVKTNPRYKDLRDCLLYTSPSPRDLSTSRMPSSA